VSSPRPLASSGRRRAATLAARQLGFVAIVLLGVLTGFGWTYVLRGLGWLSAGPRIGDSLPLLQLAGFDGQPLLRVVIAWLLAGGLAGLLLVRVRPGRRAMIAGLTGLVLLLLCAQGANALTRNLRFSDVLLHRAPGAGPWLEAVCFAIGCFLPGGLVGRLQGEGPHSVDSRFGDRGHLGLGLRQQRDTSEHDRDRDQVGDDRDRVGT
jgi:hypothetical protein